MASSYPGGYDAFTNPTATDAMNSVTVPHATQHANVNDAVEAIQAELGLDPAGASATVVARLDTLDTTVSAKAPAASPTFTGVVAVPLGSAAAPSIVPTGDTNTGIYSPGADQVGIATAGASAIVVDSTQRVGIQVTPAATLHVERDAAVAFRIARNTTDALGPFVNLFKRRGTAASPVIVNSGDTIGTLQFSTYDGATDTGVAAIAAAVDGTTGAGDLPSRLTFSTTPDGTATPLERMRIDSAGLITSGAGTVGSLAAWAAYTPTLGGFTAGSGTPTAGKWVQIGKMVHFRAIWTYGTGSAAASARPTLTLPSASHATLGGVFQAYFFDTSASAYYAAVPIQTSTTVVTMGVSGTNGISNAASTTSPFTWAAGDQIVLTGTYELA